MYWHLKQFERNRTPLLMEVEGCLMHFRSTVAVRGGVIVASKPQGLNGVLKKNTMLRIVEPSPGSQELRLKVAVPHFNLNNGIDAFMCGVPACFAGTTRRKALRYNTTRFRDFHLHLFQPNLRFRILDISLLGARALVDERGARFCPLNEPINGALLHVGKTAVSLQAVVPRVQGPNWIGFEFQFSDIGQARQRLEALIGHLEKFELQRALSPAQEQGAAPEAAGAAAPPSGPKPDVESNRAAPFPAPPVAVPV